MRHGRLRSAGFSLIELAIVLVVIGLLIGGGIVALETTTERQQRAQQERQLAQVRDALYGYAMSRRHLPCPDADYPPDGEESRDAGGDCSAAEGALPWVTLGVGSRDAWGYRLRYRVAENFASDPGSGVAFDLEEEPDEAIEVRDAVSGGERIADNVPAIVVSYGPDGGRVWSETMFLCPGTAEGLSAEASGNCDAGSATFYDPGYLRDSGDGGFRQMLVWLSDPVLKARMIEAGHLP